MTKYALLSVFNKKNIDKIAKFLISKNYKLLSSGGTAKFLASNDIQVEEVSNFTKSEELLEGRVKTLHPRVHGSILQKDLDNEYQDTLVDLDVVVCNLYPFEECLKKKLSNNDMIENIDIGGVTLLRAAAKNYKRVSILSNPIQYDRFMDFFEDLNETYRKELSYKAFLHTSLYDSKITSYLSNDIYVGNFYEKKKVLKYGANPHQGNAYYLDQIKKTEDIYNFNHTFFETLNGNPGYINYLDAYGSWNLVYDIGQTLKRVCATSFKHTSPAGVSINTKSITKREAEIYQLDGLKYDLENPSAALMTYIRARNCDPKSSFGDFIAVNTIIDLNFALYLKTCVSDGIVALDYTPDALEVLKSKKNGNYVILKTNLKLNKEQVSTKDFGTFSLSQDENTLLLEDQDRETVLGMTTLKYTQSNSICFVYDGNVIGIGAGQQNRVDCVCLARQKAFIWFMRHDMDKLINFDGLFNLTKFYSELEGKYKTERTNYIFQELERLYHCDVGLNDLKKFKKNFMNLFNLTLCSDGFFPFTDSIEEGLKINVKKVVHPGGSISDEKVKDFCDNNNITYVETGYRYFYH
jgi:phosphoribosylaminoimidazolecarboxamide formyltransferase / IMP cyclohydrolase